MELHINSIFEQLKEGLKLFYNLDEKSKEMLAKSFNDFEAELSLTQIEKITSLDVPLGDAGLRDTLSDLIHYYIHHKDQWEKDWLKFDLENEKKQIQNFTNLLNDKGLSGLNIRSELNNTRLDHVLTGITSDHFIKEILDENDKSLGYIPITRIFLELEESSKEPYTVKMDFIIDDLRAMINALQNVYDKAKRNEKRLKENIGNVAIMIGEK